MEPPEPVLIRRVRPDDGAPLHEIFIASIHTLASGAYTPDQIRAWTSHITPSRLEARMIMTISYAAELTGKIVAFGSLDANHGELDFLYVHPDYIRQGIGRRLAQTIEREAVRRGLDRLELTASLNAVAAYERLGYIRIRDMVKTIEHIAVPCVRMEKKL